MALEWVVLGYAAAAEAIMIVLLTMPGLDGLRKGLVAVTRNLLKPILIAAALVFYWILFSVTHLVVKIEQLNQRVERLKNKD